MSKTTTTALQLRIVCLDPPRTDENFGLQDKHDVLQAGSLHADGTLHFICTVLVNPRVSDAPPDFAGPLIQGKKGERFLYLSLRGEDGKYVRRIKIMLDAIPWALIGRTAEASVAGLTVALSGQQSARAKLLGDGWTVDVV